MPYISKVKVHIEKSQNHYYLRECPKCLEMINVNMFYGYIYKCNICSTYHMTIPKGYTTGRGHVLKEDYLVSTSGWLHIKQECKKVKEFIQDNREKFKIDKMKKKVKEENSIDLISL